MQDCIFRDLKFSSIQILENNINILLQWMKQQKQNKQIDRQPSTRIRFLVDRIHIKVKFCCRLYLEYLSNEESRKSKEIKLDQKNDFYRIDEQINVLIRNISSRGSDTSETLVIYVKLMSSKGLAFTAGVISIATEEFQHYAEMFTLKFNKSQDFDVYCECRRLQITSNSNQKIVECHQNVESLKNTLTIAKQKTCRVELDYKTFSEHHINQRHSEIDETPRHTLYSNIDYRQGERRLKKSQYFQSQFRQREKELMHRIQDLETESHKNCVLFEKQKEIIILLQSKQTEGIQERNELKKYIKVIEIEVEQKRQKIRELQGEKLKLLMNALHSEKEVGALKQKIEYSLQKVYENIKNMFHQKNRKILRDFTEKQLIADRGREPFVNSLSKIVQKQRDRNSKSPKQKQYHEESSKVSFSAVRGLINKEVDQAWFEESLGFRDVNPSSVLSNTLNDMSISDINGKAKEVSLLNSDLFLKIPESEPIIRSSSRSKKFFSQIGKSMKKLQNMVALQIQKTIQSFIQVLENNKSNGKDGSSVEESLLGYLEQLQNGFERQLGALGQKQKIILYYEELIEQLNQTLSEKQNLVVQLEEQLFKLQEERDHIRSEIHQINYAHALKEEEFIKKIHILQHGKTMPDYSSSSSPTRQLGRRKQTKNASPCYQQELIEHKQHLRMLQIDLLHERDEKAKITHQLHRKQLQLQEILNEKRRLQFAIKIRERMNSLNQSIELSIEEEKNFQPQNNEKFTQQSLSNEQDYMNILICQQ